MNNPPTNLPQHYWVSTGSGEWSSKFVRPICSNDPNHIRHIDDFAVLADRSGERRCPDCVAVVDALGTEVKAEVKR